MNFVDKLIQHFVQFTPIFVLWDYVHFSYCMIMSIFHIVAFFPGGSCLVGFCQVGFCPRFLEEAVCCQLGRTEQL